MSVTTTNNAHITALRHTLADYNLHHSQPSSAEASSAPEPNAQTHWRRVPAYRPANPALLDEGGRNEFNNTIERYFIRVMFGGVGEGTLMKTRELVKFGGRRGGRVNDRIFRVGIGGEW
ncbi:hypothetical protein CLAFUR0_12723 [Fulvia fulva]|nr:hypothetical protein CLAFUR0_12723 [Fulvia fulva]